MKILLIDSHKGSEHTVPQNLHWLNISKIQKFLISKGHDVHLIWSYPSVNTNIQTGYDIIVFNHASAYAYVDLLWIEKNPDAKLFYITNEYNLGEPRILWSAVKQYNKKFHVIANHPMAASKVVKQYVASWNIVNLNALIVEDIPLVENNTFFEFEKENCIYYGSFRKNRTKYFEKYLKGRILISTHPKNIPKFQEINVSGPFQPRVNWKTNGLDLYKTSLYIEDTVTHTHYNFLANRFYESLNYNVFPLFDINCKNSIELSGYTVPEFAMVSTEDNVIEVTHHLGDIRYEYLAKWRSEAVHEKKRVLDTIYNILI
jgi:hypothetical protein